MTNDSQPPEIQVSNKIRQSYDLGAEGVIAVSCSGATAIADIVRSQEVAIQGPEAIEGFAEAEAGLAQTMYEQERPAIGPNGRVSKEVPLAIKVDVAFLHGISAA